MKRIPSIHIREDILAKALIELEFADESTAPGTAVEIMEFVKQYAVTNRSITVTNEKLYQKAAKMNASSRDNTSKFGNVLVFVRRKQNKFAKLKLPKPGTNDYLAQKEAAKDATLFCERFDLKWREGFIEYATIGLGMMKNFSFYKFKNLYEAISETYEAKALIGDDDDKAQTEKIFKYWVSKVAQMTGLTLHDYQQNQKKYRYFIETRKQSLSSGVPPRIWVDAQFWFFDSMGRYPEPEQMTGPKALPRVQKYMVENNIRIHNGKKNNNNSSK